jgi:ADP-heptose:LPS heptosyltransferase
MQDHGLNNPHILVIKHSAFGDWLMATGAMRAIRQHWKGAHITLLTTKPFASLANACGWFDAVWIDTRPKWYQWPEWWALARQLNGEPYGRRFDFIYDLQTSQRTGSYYRLLRPPRTPWSGIAKGCSHRHNTPQRTTLHSIDRMREQMQLAGIADVPEPNLDWLSGDLGPLQLDERYGLLVPGCAPHRLEKRWPAAYYAELAGWMVAQNITPLIIGTSAEAESAAVIMAHEPKSRSLINQTAFGQLASLARGAALAVGNDTGPMHLIALAGAPCLTLFSNASSPQRSAPRGENAHWLQQACLNDLKPAQVVQKLQEHFPEAQKLS